MSRVADLPGRWRVARILLHVIISTDLRFVLFSVNKTGTSSMDLALAPYFDEIALREAFQDEARFPRELIDQDVVRRSRLRKRKDWNRVSRLKHATPTWLAERWPYLYPEMPFADMYKACFVRDPFDRLVSIYAYHTQTLSNVFPEARAAGSFKAWLEMGGTGSAKKPMQAFTHDRKGHQIVDFIARYESLQRDWQEFLSAVGLPALEFPHHPGTKTTHESASRVLTPELREIVLANPTWRADAQAFGYI